MAEATVFEQLLIALRGEGDRLLILVEDSGVETGWRIVTEADLAEMARSLESNSAEDPGLPGRLCCNVEEAARSVGVSVHKFNTWIQKGRPPRSPYQRWEKDSDSTSFASTVARR